MQDLLRAQLEPLLDTTPARGFVAGAVLGGETVTVAIGDADVEEVHEIGSITKTMTATLLADLVTRHIVSLDEQIWPHLPPEARPTSPPDITFRDLATHRSGLPRLAPNLMGVGFDLANPYAHFTAENLYQALREVVVDEREKRAALYSNFGFGLLGHLLEQVTDMPYNDLLRSTLFDPLGMQRTTAGEPTGPKADGHDAEGNGVPWWDKTTATWGAGTVRAPIADLLVWGKATMGSGDGLADAITLAKDTPLGWARASTPSGMDIVWHNGGTGGFGAMLAVRDDGDGAVAAITNVSHPQEMDAAVVRALEALTAPS